MFDVYMCLFCVCVVLCLGRGLASPTVSKNDHETEKEARAHGGCRASEKKKKRTDN
jgi:hypothetical protein